MIPVITLVGRPNVGKSTLFNRLTRTSNALVADFPCLTRDRQYSKAEFAGQQFIIIDTGGMDGSEDGLKKHITNQTLIAIEEADIIFFIVDVRTGLMPEDYAMAKYLHSRNKDTYLVANKIDGLDIDSGLVDFYALGFKKNYAIAASHGHGVNQLMDQVILSYYSPQLAKQIKSAEEHTHPATKEHKVNINKSNCFLDLLHRPIKLAIVGQPNVGKSTLINRLLEEDRVVVYDLPGTTRDSIYIPMKRDRYEYVLIDTAGVRKRGKITEKIEKISVIKTLRSIEEAHVVLLLIDAQKSISYQDLSLLGFIINAGRALVIVVNKWDCLSQEERKDVQYMLDLRLGFLDFAHVHFISALHGSGVGNYLFDSIHEAYESATRRVSTALLTRILRMAEDEYKPPLIRDRRVKMKYAHAGGYNPPTFIIHGNQVANLPNAYKRYLINYFRRSLKMMGTPIRLQFKEGDNPYAGKNRNK